VKKALILISAMTLLFTAPVRSQEYQVRAGDTLTLSRCIEISLRRHPDIIASRHSAEITEALLGQARKDYFPSIDLSGGYARYNNIYKLPTDPYTTITPDRNSYPVAVTLTQNIYDFGIREANVASSSLTHQSSLWNTNDKIREVVNAVRENYYDLLKSNRERKVQAEKVSQYRRHLEQARLFYQAGTKAKYDVTKAEVDLSGARLDLIQAENNLKLSYETLNNTMGIFDAPAYELEDILAHRESPRLGLGDALAQAYGNRPDLKSLQVQIEAAEKAVEAARRSYFPTIKGTAGYNADGSEYPLSSGWNVGVSLVANIFDGFSTQQKIAAKKAEVKRLQARADAQRLQINLEVKKAYLNLEKALQSIGDAEVQVRQAADLLELVNLKYTAGLSNSLEVTDATVSHADANLRHIKALYEYRKAEANIEKAIGKR
jgi:outer membrane protein TolC